MPAMHIDESSTTGNAEVIMAVFRELRREASTPTFASVLRIIAGDQLSIARLRAIILNRLGHDLFPRSFLWAVFMPGLFHYKLAFTHGFMDIHYGKSNSPANPGCLNFQDTILDCKPIVLSSFPPFRVARDLIMVSLYARIFVCLEHVSSVTFNEYATAALTYEKLKRDATRIYERYVDPDVVSRLREARDKEEHASEKGAPLKHREGDMIFENAVLFIHDALIFRELNDAIKAGDSGRVVLVLKPIALMYRGMGRTKYAYEMLHLIHNLTCVWPEPLKKVILDNWLVNTTGKENAWSEVDLLQEHLNYWIKVIYKAHGSNASWEWLAMILPCIDILRHLATQIHQDLGARQGVKHTSPALQHDIDVLKDSLREHEVYVVKKGRTIDQEDPVVPNVVTAGLNALSAPLNEYNKAFRRLQQRCRMKPLVGDPYVASEGRPTPSNTSTSTQVSEEPSTSGEGTTVAEPTELSADEEEDEAEASLWQIFDDEEAEGEGFSLETAQDVSLDMDAVEDDEEY